MYMYMYMYIGSGLHFTGITVALLPVEDILVGSGDKRVKIILINTYMYMYVHRIKHWTASNHHPMIVYSYLK